MGKITIGIEAAGAVVVSNHHGAHGSVFLFVLGMNECYRLCFESGATECYDGMDCLETFFTRKRDGLDGTD